MLIPTQETAKWVVGAYATGTATSYLATNKQTAKLPGNVLTATNKFLEKFNNRTSPKPTEYQNEIRNYNRVQYEKR